MTVKIQELGINYKKTLDSSTKRVLEHQLVQFFNEQERTFDLANEEQKRKIIDAYKTSCGFSKKIGKIKQAESEVNTAKNNLELTGLNEHGSIACEEEIKTWDTSEEKRRKEEKNKAIKRINEMVSKITKQAPEFERTKIIARLWISSTIGEAVVIINQIMGNGVIPTLSNTQVKELGYDNQGK